MLWWVISPFYDFAVFDPSPLTLWITVVFYTSVNTLSGTGVFYFQQNFELSFFFSFRCLIFEVARPIGNLIAQKVGYRPRCNFRNWDHNLGRKPPLKFAGTTPLNVVPISINFPFCRCPALEWSKISPI